MIRLAPSLLLISRRRRRPRSRRSSSPAAASTRRSASGAYDVTDDRPRAARSQRRRTGSRTCCATCRASSNSAAPTRALPIRPARARRLRALGGNASSRALLILDGVPQTRSVRRLDQPGRPTIRAGSAGSAWCAAAAPAPTARARWPARSSSKARPGELEGAGREPRLWQPRQRRRVCRLWRAARRRLRQRLRRLCARRRLHSDRRAASAAPPIGPRPTARRASPSRACAPLSADDRASGQCLGLHRRARARHRLQRDRHAGRRRLAAAGRPRPPALRRCSPMSRSAISPTASPRSAPAARPRPRRSTNISVPSTGLGARVEVRPVTGPLEIRLGADWRETDGPHPGAVPVRRRRADARPRRRRPDRHARRLRRGRLGTRPAHPHRRRPDRPMADRRTAACASACSPPARR